MHSPYNTIMDPTTGVRCTMGTATYTHILKQYVHTWKHLHMTGGKNGATVLTPTVGVQQLGGRDTRAKSIGLRPDNQLRVVVIGDIHGNYDALKDILSKAQLIRPAVASGAPSRGGLFAL